MKQKEIEKNKTRHSREGVILKNMIFLRFFQEKIASKASKMVLMRKKQFFNKQEPKLLKLAQ